VSSFDYRVAARNPAAASENRIHADDVARRYGFRAALVPGVTVYAYACHAIVQALGPAWVEAGAAGIRFASPCYDGDHLVIGASGTPTVQVTVSSGERTAATGWAALPGEGPRGWPLPDIPTAATPAADQRPAADEEQLAAGRVLGTIPIPTDAAINAAYLDRIGEPSPLYRQKGWVHPALLLEAANRVLTASVVLTAWLHVETEVRHLGRSASVSRSRCGAGWRTPSSAKGTGSSGSMWPGCRPGRRWRPPVTPPCGASPAADFTTGGGRPRAAQPDPPPARTGAGRPCDRGRKEWQSRRPGRHQAGRRTPSMRPR
jgi:hypothetical protein